jgi:hypothetical protein
MILPEEETTPVAAGITYCKMWIFLCIATIFQKSRIFLKRMAETTRLELATSAVTADGTAIHWKYILGNAIVYRDVYRD